MLIREFEDLPDRMKTPAVRIYYDMLAEKRKTLILKRIFDMVVSSLLIVILLPVMTAVAVWIKIDSKGPVFYRQRRMTKDLREFKIIKFRTMRHDAGSSGLSVTVLGDERITKAGRKLRKSRMDELPQIFNVLLGGMSFAGTRPEVKKYVDGYTDEMFATLLLPAGITSKASVLFRDEERLLGDSHDPETVYVKEILPQKMVYNLEYLRDFRFSEDIKILFRTLFPGFDKRG